MTNEKLILETLVDHAERLADLHQAIAGLTSLLAARLTNLSPEEKLLFEKVAEIEGAKVPAIKSFGEVPLREALFRLEKGADA